MVRGDFPAEVLLLAVLNGELTQRQVDMFIDNVVIGRTIETLSREERVSRACVSFHVKAARRRLRRALRAMAEQAEVEVAA